MRSGIRSARVAPVIAMFAILGAVASNGDDEGVVLGVSNSTAYMDAARLAFADAAAAGRIALFYVNDDYGRGLRNAVRAGWSDQSSDMVVDTP